jgi:hypothetical protein
MKKKPKYEKVPRKRTKRDIAMEITRMRLADEIFLYVLTYQ